MKRRTRVVETFCVFLTQICVAFAQMVFFLLRELYLQARGWWRLQSRRRRAGFSSLDRGDPP